MKVLLIVDHIAPSSKVFTTTAVTRCQKREGETHNANSIVLNTIVKLTSQLIVKEQYIGHVVESWQPADNKTDIYI